MIKEIKFGVLPHLNYASREAVNELCTSIKFAGADKNVIMFTSTHPGEGKSFLSMNVAFAFAELGYRTIFVDCDLRRSNIKSVYRLRTENPSIVGLAHFLARMNNLEEVIYRVSNVPKLSIIPVGKHLDNSLSLLNTNEFHSMIAWLKSAYDFVIVDTPPVGAIADATQIATSCDGVVMISKYNSTSLREFATAKEHIERSGCEILGAVINDVPMDSLSGKHYYRNYDYKYKYKNKYSSHGSGRSAKSSSGKKTQKQKAHAEEKE